MLRTPGPEIFRILSLSLVSSIIFVCILATFQFVWYWQKPLELKAYFVPVIVGTGLGLIISRIWLQNTNQKIQERILKNALETNSDLALTFSKQQHINYISPAIKTWFNLSQGQISNLFQLREHIHSKDIDFFDYFIDDLIKGQAPHSIKIRFIGKDNNLIYAEASGGLAFNNTKQQEFFLHLKDNTKLEESLQKLQEQTYFDGLTGLASQTALEQYIHRKLASQSSFSVILLDIANFHSINQTHGHQLGNNLLKEVAQRLNTWYLHEDLRGLVARLRADIFALVLIKEYQSSSQLSSLADEMDGFYAIHGEHFHLNFRIGLARAPLDDLNVSGLLQKADIALHAAKRDESQQIVCYSRHLYENSYRAFVLESRLRECIMMRNLHIALQPIMDSKTLQPKSFEALCRWHDDELGNISPGVFIPLAEDKGLITGLGDVVLHKSLEWFKLVCHYLPKDCLINVNVSGIQLQSPDFVKNLMQMLESYQLQAQHLVIEITESVFIENDDRVMENLHHLHLQGVNLALDDFGSGYANLSMLIHPMISKIKIDQSLVQRMLDEPTYAIMIKTTIDMVHNLGKLVVVEGVETQEQLNKLVAMKADMLQGFYFGQPKLANDMLQLMRG